jgi:hypothetical protein
MSVCCERYTAALRGGVTAPASRAELAPRREGRRARFREESPKSKLEAGRR